MTFVFNFGLTLMDGNASVLLEREKITLRLSFMRLFCSRANPATRKAHFCLIFLLALSERFFLLRPPILLQSTFSSRELEKIIGPHF